MAHREATRFTNVQRYLASYFNTLESLDDPLSETLLSRDSIEALLDDFPGASNESLAQTASLTAFLNGSNDPTDALSIGRSVYFPGLAAANALVSTRLIDSFMG
jgi:hypothetical protein